MSLWPNILPNDEERERCWTCDEVPASWVPGYGYTCEACIDATMEEMERWVDAQKEGV